MERAQARRWRVVALALLVWVSAWMQVAVAQTTAASSSSQAAAWLSSRTGGSLHFEWCVSFCTTLYALTGIV